MQKYLGFIGVEATPEEAGKMFESIHSRQKIIEALKVK